MLTTVLAYLVALVVTYISSLIIGLTFGLLNTIIAGMVVAAVSSVLLKQGVPLESVERSTSKIIGSFVFTTGVVVGVADVLLASIVFHWFGKEMGWLMVAILVAMQLMPTPSFIQGDRRAHMRATTLGTIIGQVGTWLIYFG